MDRLLSIGQAAKAYGVSVSTLRRWERAGKITAERTVGNQRRYKITELNFPNHTKKQSVKMTIAYARVSSHDQKSDLERQKHVLEAYCASYGWSLEIIFTGSGQCYEFIKLN
jgi:excisionase family DNA binding protein